MGFFLSSVCSTHPNVPNHAYGVLPHTLLTQQFINYQLQLPFNYRHLISVLCYHPSFFFPTPHAEAFTIPHVRMGL